MRYFSMDSSAAVDLVIPHVLVVMLFHIHYLVVVVVVCRGWCFVVVVVRNSTISNGRIFGRGERGEGALVGLIHDHLLIRLVLVDKMDSRDRLVRRSK